MSFSRLYLLHGKGGSPNGTVKLLKHAMVPTMRGIVTIRPELPHGRAGGTAEESLFYLQQKHIPEGAVLIGVSLGGLVAARLQELSRPDLTLCVLARQLGRRA